MEWGDGMTTTYRCDTCRKLMHGPDIPPPEPNFCPRCDTGKLHRVRVISSQMLRDAEVAR